MRKRFYFWLAIGCLSLAWGCGEKAPEKPVGRPEATPEATKIAKPAVTPTAARGPNERFYTVQSKLDQGGSLYLYIDVKDVLRGILKTFEPFVKAPNAPPEVAKSYDNISMAIDKLGLHGVQDLGVSVLPEGDHTLIKSFLGAPEGRTGILKLFGERPHPIEALAYAPQDTLLFSSLDFDAAGGLELARQIVQQIGGVEKLREFDQMLAQSGAMMGLNIPTILQSFGGEFSLIATLDPADKVNLPTGKQPVSFDSPNFLAMATVKDAALYEAIKGLATRFGMAGPEAADGDLKRTPLTIPPNPAWAISPAIACDGRRFYISTHDAYLSRVLKTKAGGGTTLRDAEEFKALSAGLPTDGNSMAFVGKRVMETYVNVLKDAAAAKGNAQEAMMTKAMMNQFGAMSGSGVYSIGRAEADGFLKISRSSFKPQQYVASLAAVPAAILGAIAVPNFLEAQDRSKVARAKADMRSMSVALEAYFIDTNSYPMWSADPAQNAFGDLARTNPVLAAQPTFMTPALPNRNIATLTTPISYLLNYMEDPFAPVQGATYSYFAPLDAKKKPGKNWILWSAGPDEKYDLTLDRLQGILKPDTVGAANLLSDYTFDPTNGTVSSGDIWHLK